MKELRIKIIIFLMTIAVIGLIGVQLYWIANAFRVEEQKFKAGVNDALLSTVKELEKRETESAVIRKLVDVNGKTDSLIIRSDSSAFPKIYHIAGSQGKNGPPKLFYKYDINSHINNDTGITSVNYFNWKSIHILCPCLHSFDA